MKNVIFAILIVLSCATFSYAGDCPCTKATKPVVATVVVTPVRTVVTVLAVRPVRTILQNIQTRKPVRTTLQRIFGC